jgi:hypothetical protein
MTVRDLMEKLIQYDLNNEVIINTSTGLVGACPHCEQCMVEYCPRCGEAVSGDDTVAESEELFPYDMTKEVNGRVRVIIRAEIDERKVTR